MSQGGVQAVAVDLGASGGRVLLAELTGTAGGRKLSLSEVHRFSHEGVFVPTDAGGAWHWDALRLWSETQAGVRKAVRAGGGIRSVGVDTWGVDFALLDAGGALLANPVCYRDARTAGMIEAVQEVVPAQELFARAGLQFMPFNTVYQLLALQRQQPHLLEQTDRLVLMPDLLHYWFSGEKVAERTNASTTQFFHAGSRDWDRDLLARLGLPDRILPPLVDASTPLGPVRPEIRDEVGLPAGTRVVVPGTHDTASAVAATPGEGTDWAFLSTGTWCLLGAEVDRPYLEPAVFAAGFGNEGGVRGTVRLLRNITGLWLVQECRRAWAAEGTEYGWEELTRLAREARPFSALLDPDHPGFVKPHRMPQAIADYCRATGQRPPEGPGETIRASLEGIALTVRRRWEELERVLGRRLNVLHAVGGGTQNTLLCQFLADALGRTVLAGPTEATAAGNALAQFVGHGELDFTEARAVVRRSFGLQEYRPAGGSEWDDAYHRFRAQGLG